MSLFRTPFAAVPLTSPSLDAMSAPTAKRKMSHRRSCLRVVFLSPNSSSSSYLLCSSDSSHATSSPPPSVPILVTHSSFHPSISVLVLQRSRTSSAIGSRWPPENQNRVRLVKLHRLRRSRTRSSVQLHHKHALPLVHRNPLARARVLDVRSLHNDVSLVDNRTHGSQRSFDVSVHELRVALHAIPNEFQSRVSFHTSRTTVCFR